MVEYASQVIDLRILGRTVMEKDITFHCSFHTVATLAISTGADLSAVGKILGHKSSVSTQVYAKVSLEKKVAVTKLVDGCLDRVDIAINGE